MSKLPGKLTHGAAGAAGVDWWCQRREASLNWLALGLLLAAWNASENDPPEETPQRPAALHGYHYVSVRAAQRVYFHDRAEGVPDQ